MAFPSLTPHRARSVEQYRPASPLLSFYQQANRLFEDAFRDFDDARETLGSVFAPSIDIIQNERETRITAELPGVKEEDVDISVDNDMLTIRAEKRVERMDDQHTRHVSERTYGTFQRSLRLSQPVDPDQVRAHFDHGVLTVILARTQPKTDRRKIMIESGPAPESASETPPESRH